MARTRIDNAGVIEAACSLADAGGLDALTLSAVAEVLGVRPSALYTYVDGAGHLHHVVAIQATHNLTDHVRRAAIGVAGENAVRAMAEAYRQFARSHPGQYAALVAPPDAVDDQLRVASQSLQDLLVTVLAGLGLDDDIARQAATSMRSMLHGFVALETVAAHEVDADHFESVVTAMVLGLGITAG